MAKATAIQETVTLYHPHGRFTIDFNLTPINERRRLLSDGKWTGIPGWRLSICGATANSGGQNRDELSALARTLKLPGVSQLCMIWDRWHLNDMRPGDGKAWYYEPLPKRDVLNVWRNAVAEIKKYNAERAAAIAAASEDEDEDDPRDEFEILAEDNDMDPGLLRQLADHLNVSADDALAYHQEHYQGEHDSDAAFAEQLADDLGMVNRDAKWPNTHIDWDAAAGELFQSDYFSIDGHVYRNA